ncbi:Aspartate aminotransferase [gamma proteobacterium IMCC2047]|nr:Aspartate aminotransferase [gamma proteobacterium IMCC2047]
MFENLSQLPDDPILGLMVTFKEDRNPNKIDLGVGVYKTEQGETPVLKSVKQAERELLEQEKTKLYIGPAGAPEFTSAIEKLVLGDNHPALASQRVSTLQTPGGSGALRVAAELAKKGNPNATIWVGNPTWGNHIPLLSDAGLQIKTFPYYDVASHGVDFDGMMEALAQAKTGDLVLLHGCCHNPSGADLSPQQWQAVTELASQQGFTPFIDIAYQGFGTGIDEDAYGVRLMAENLPELLIASSCSKNFGIYRERVGSVLALSKNSTQAQACSSQLARIVRGIYSMPPSHGAAVVAHILQNDTLRQQWLDELNTMRERIFNLRGQLLEQLTTKGANSNFSFITQQSGMFSFLDINPEQVQRLRDEFSIYMTGDSRINVAGVNRDNIDYLSSAIASVL